MKYIVACLEGLRAKHAHSSKPSFGNILKCSRCFT
jgi:hypothetical protein